jgi:uncharacterized protein involved in response to NO
MPDPYRVLFPLGLLFGLIGAGSWPAHLLGIGEYPAALHRTLMITGFVHGFVLGFLLTAMPGFTHGPPCRPLELGVVTTAYVLSCVATLFGQPVPAYALFLVTLIAVAIAAVSRIVRASVPPPEEFLFAGFALLCGLAGAALQIALALGVTLPLPPRFPERLVSLGMVLSLVLGLGALLVPTFAGMRAPLALPFAPPHARGGARRALYVTLIAALAGAFALEAVGHARSGAVVRAAAALVVLVLGWKLAQAPGRHDVPAWSLWIAGWMTGIGLVAAAVVPRSAMTGVLHFVFIGGFALLTLGVSTRVVVSHGRHGLPTERAVLTPAVVAMLGLALALRLTAELVGGRPLRLLAASATAWIVAWTLWAMGAVPRIVATRPAPPPSTVVPLADVSGSSPRPTEVP